MATFTNLKEFVDGLAAEKANFRQKMSAKMYRLVTTLHHDMTALTPVQTGQALANYQWSMGSPSTTLEPDYGTGSIAGTNDMALGTEPRRPDNQAIADESVALLSFTNPYQVYWMANNDPTIGPLEDGAWPETPFRQRSPQGMIRISLAVAFAKLEAGVL